jgi:hypothetical protein
VVVSLEPNLSKAHLANRIKINNPAYSVNHSLLPLANQTLTLQVPLANPAEACSNRLSALASNNHNKDPALALLVEIILPLADKDSSKIPALDSKTLEDSVKTRTQEVLA